MGNRHYFKQTTRRLLTEKQKIATIEVLERGFSYLSNKCKEIDLSQYEFGDPEIFDALNKRMVYFSRWTNLIKGLTQPKNFYNTRRRNEIAWRAHLISKDTDADYEAVKLKLLSLMSDYIKPNDY